MSINSQVWAGQFVQSAKLEGDIKKNLKGLGYDFKN